MESRKRPVSFNTSFWEKDVTSTEGFERLQKRMKEGKITCDVTEKLIKARAKADEDYGKALLKISKAAGEAIEVGSLKNSLDCLKNELDKMAQSSLESSKHLNEIGTNISEFNRLQRTSRKNLEDAITNQAKTKTNLYKKNLELKRFYHVKSHDADSASAEVFRAKNDSSCTEKDFDRVTSRCQEAQNAASKSEKEYRQNVVKLSEVMTLWETQMSEYCKMCENLEEKRLEFLREQLWQTCNIISVNCVEIDGKCESVRNSLENVSIDSDIISFINRACTGNEPPDAVKFEPFISNDRV